MSGYTFTPQMIEAGVKELRESGRLAPGASYDDELAKDVFNAMWNARRSGQRYIKSITFDEKGEAHMEVGVHP